jgi:hypothetical protein
MRVPPGGFGPTRFEDPTEVLCTRCHEPLDRHQPDQDQPGRQLGTCPGCGAWFLIDARKGVMYAVPDVWALPPRATG